MGRSIYQKTFFILLLFWVVGMLFMGCGQSEAQNENHFVLYKVYFGLNDKGTGEQEISVDEASERIRGIITQKGYGYTEYTTRGAYLEAGVAIENDTLVYELFDIEKEAVEAIAAEAAEALNLNSVVCVQSPAEVEFLQAGPASRQTD